MKTTSPKVSIIITVYNLEKYIEKCIHSCMVQTYEEIEIVVIDDGSSDGSVEIEKKISRKDSRIKLIVKENQGLVRARKIGFESATGNYIFFLDADDYLEPDAIEILIKEAIESNSDLVIGGCIYENENGQVVTSWTSKLEGNSQIEYLKALFLNKIQPNIWGRLIKHDIFQSVAVPDHYFGGEDIIANVMMISYNEHIKISVINDLLYHYVIRNESLTNTYTPDEFLDYTSEIEAVLNKVDLEKHVIREWSIFVIRTAWLRYLRKGGRDYLKDKSYVNHIYKKFYTSAKKNMKFFEKTEVLLYRKMPKIGRYYSLLLSKLMLLRK